MPIEVSVPRLVDRDSTNPQNLNAKSLLSRFTNSNLAWTCSAYGVPDLNVVRSSRVSVIRTSRGRFWPWSIVRLYGKRRSHVFYPGREWFDLLGVRLRGILQCRTKIIATLEGLAGDAEREQQLSAVAGHQVYCQHVDRKVKSRCDRILGAADHIIAISPFLKKMGEVLYGPKMLMLPLGIDTNTFHAKGRTPRSSVRVISAGRVDSHKRPEVMLQMALSHPSVEFVWFGDGGMRRNLIRDATERNISNVFFPGIVDPTRFADELRRSDVFIMPSLSEGVPKVTQEAAACGCAQVVFGFYEAPSVEDGVNGYVVWDDAQFHKRLEELITDRALACRFGQQGAEMARNLWDWDKVALQWEESIWQLLNAPRGGLHHSART
jgi:glycosyltransferase involved in cell wall biosynthesis